MQPTPKLLIMMCNKFGRGHVEADAALRDAEAREVEGGEPLAAEEHLASRSAREFLHGGGQRKTKKT